MELEKFKKLIEKGEDMKVEFKTTPILSPSEENRVKIAGQLVAFANRKGGCLILGINDNRTFEGARIDEDKEIQKISNVAKDKCSPPVVFAHQFIQTNEGDILIVEVERRKGIPHAVIERDNHEIKKRTYYIRTSKGNRLVDDKTLEWLFNNIGDPKISSKFRFFITYNRKTLGLPPYECPISFWQFVSFFNSLSEDNKKYLLEDETSRISSFLVEVAHFAMLQYLANLFWHSWQIEVFRTKGERITSPRKAALKGKKVNLSNIPIPQNSLLSKLSFDLKKILKTSVGEIVVPPDAEVKIHFSDLQKERFIKSVLGIYKKDAFSIEIKFSVSRWSSGLPYASPLRYKYQRIDIPFERRTLERRKKFEAEIASIGINITFNTDFKFPDVNDPIFNEYFEYGKIILAQLRLDWDWDNFLSRLPHGKLYSIEDKNDEILQRLNNKSQL